MATKTKTKAKSKAKAKPARAPAKKPLRPKAAAKAKKPAASASPSTPQDPAGRIFCWHEIGTTDVPGAKAFYSGLFGWKTQDVPMGPCTYTLLTADGQQIAGLYAMTGPEWEGKDVPPHWLTYVAVPDVDAYAQRAASLGGKVCHPPSDIPGIGRFSVLTDPAGATFAIYKSTRA